MRHSLVLVEPASSMGPVARAGDDGGFLLHEGFSPKRWHAIIRITAFTPKQLICDSRLPWYPVRREPATVLPLVRFGPPALAWFLLAVQLIVLTMGRRLTCHPLPPSVTLVLNPQAGVLGMVHAGLSDGYLITRLQTDPVLPAQRGRTAKQRLVSRVLRRSDVVVANSDFTKRQAVSLGVTQDRCLVLYPPVDAIFTQEAHARCRAEERAHHVAYLGRLEPEKGILDALEAFERLAGKGPFRFSIAGRGSLEDRVKRALRDPVHDRTRLYGYVPRPELPLLLDQIGIVVVPTLIEEGFGRVSVEAGLRGCITVGYESGGLNEAAGPAALLVARGDKAALSDAVLSVAEQWNQRSQASRAHANAVYSYTLRTLESVILEALGLNR